MSHSMCPNIKEHCCSSTLEHRPWYSTIWVPAPLSSPLPLGKSRHCRGDRPKISFTISISRSPRHGDPSYHPYNVIGDSQQSANMLPPAFQLPLIAKSPDTTHTSPFPLTTSKPLSLRLRFARAQPPPSRPPNGRSGRRRPTVGVWLTGHDDVSVLSAAALASTHPIRVTGSFTDVLTCVRHLRLSVLYLHVRSVTLLQIQRLRLSQVVPVLIGQASSPASPSTSVPVLAPAPDFALLATALAPVIVERKGESVVRFFDRGSDENSVFSSEKRKLDQTPWISQIGAWLTRVYLPQGFPNTTTPDYISFTKFRTLQNLASAVMQVIR